MEAAVVARRARTENFPVASLLFPRACGRTCAPSTASPGSSTSSATRSEGDRLALARRARAGGRRLLRGRADVAGDAARSQPTIREFDLPREPFLRLIEANRMDQRIAEYETWADLKEYCRHSADPVGRLVLGLLAARRRARARRRERRRLHRAPARQLPAGRAARPRARAHLPAARGPPSVRRDRARPPEPRAARAARVRGGARARALLAGGRMLQERIGGRVGRAVGLFARGGLAALDALERAGWDVFTQRPRPSRPRLALAALRTMTARARRTPRSSG